MVHMHQYTEIILVVAVVLAGTCRGAPPAPRPDWCDIGSPTCDLPDSSIELILDGVLHSTLLPCNDPLVTPLAACTQACAAMPGVRFAVAQNNSAARLCGRVIRTLMT